jgi:hypothetical protein
VGGELVEQRVGARAQADGGGVAREHDRRVADGLPAGQLQLARPQDHGVAAELDDAGLHRRPRPRRRLFEQQRHRPAVEDPRDERGGLELARTDEEALELVARELPAGDEVPGQATDS